MSPVVTTSSRSGGDQLCCASIERELVDPASSVLTTIQKSIRACVNGTYNAICWINSTIACADLGPHVQGTIEAIQESATRTVDGDRVQEISTSRDISPVVDCNWNHSSPRSDNYRPCHVESDPFTSVLCDPKLTTLIHIAYIIRGCTC